MKQEETGLQSKVLYDLFRSALNFENACGYDGWYYYEKYIEYKQKYIHTLMAMSEIMIHDVSRALSPLKLNPDNAQITHDTLLIVTDQFRKISDEAFKGLIELLDNHINLKNVENIHGYTEFDILEWDIDERGKVSIKYKPKDINVSFWHADPNDIQMK
jgi:hypothetical protein